MQEEGSASPSQPQGHLREHLFSSVNPCHRHLVQGLGAGAPVPRPEGPCSALALACFVQCLPLLGVVGFILS